MKRPKRAQIGLKERIVEAQALLDVLKSKCAHEERNSELLRQKDGFLRAGHAMVDEAMKVK